MKLTRAPLDTKQLHTTLKGDPPHYDNSAYIRCTYQFETKFTEVPKLTHLFSQCCGISGSRPDSLRKLENLGVAFHHTPISDSILRAKTLGEIWMGGKGLLVFACGWRGNGGGDEGRPTSMEQPFCNNPASHAISTNAAPEPENSIRLIFGDICRR